MTIDPAHSATAYINPEYAWKMHQVYRTVKPILTEFHESSEAIIHLVNATKGVHLIASTPICIIGIHDTEGAANGDMAFYIDKKFAKKLRPVELPIIRDCNGDPYNIPLPGEVVPDKLVLCKNGPDVRISPGHIIKIDPDSLIYLIPKACQNDEMGATIIKSTIAGPWQTQVLKVKKPHDIFSWSKIPATPHDEPVYLNRSMYKLIAKLGTYPVIEKVTGIPGMKCPRVYRVTFVDDPNIVAYFAGFNDSKASEETHDPA